MSPSLNQSDSNVKSHTDVDNICSFLNTLNVYCACYISDSAVLLHRVPSGDHKSLQWTEQKYGRLNSTQWVRLTA